MFKGSETVIIYVSVIARLDVQDWMFRLLCVLRKKNSAKLIRDKSPQLSMVALVFL